MTYREPPCLQMLTVPELKTAARALHLAVGASSTREQVLKVLNDALTEGSSAGDEPQVAQPHAMSREQHCGAMGFAIV